MKEIPIQGMTCEHCVAHVTKAIAKVPGVTSVKVDLAAGLAHVDGEPDLQALATAVADEGYQAIVQ